MVSQDVGFTQKKVQPEGTSTKKLPYCEIRWCENEQTHVIAAEIWPRYCKFVELLMTLPKSIQPKSNKRYDGLITVVTDTLVCAKLKFAEMLSWKFNKVLRGFQTDNPMVSFLYLLWRGYCDGYWKNLSRKNFLLKLILEEIC